MLHILKTAEPTVDPVTIPEVMTAAGIPESADLDMVRGMIKSAVTRGEYLTGRQFVATTFEAHLDAFPGSAYASWDMRPNRIDLIDLYPISPRSISAYTSMLTRSEIPLLPDVQEVTSITYLQGDRSRATWDPSHYLLRSFGLVGKIQLVEFDEWPVDVMRFADIVISFTAGYPLDANNKPTTPYAIKQWIKTMVATWYEYPEALTPGALSSIPTGFVDGLLEPYKIPVVP